MKKILFIIFLLGCENSLTKSSSSTLIENTNELDLNDAPKEYKFNEAFTPFIFSEFGLSDISVKYPTSLTSITKEGLKHVKAFISEGLVHLMSADSENLKIAPMFSSKKSDLQVNEGYFWREEFISFKDIQQSYTFSFSLFFTKEDEAKLVLTIFAKDKNISITKDVYIVSPYATFEISGAKTKDKVSIIKLETTVSFKEKKFLLSNKEAFDNSPIFNSDLTTKKLSATISWQDFGNGQDLQIENYPPLKSSSYSQEIDLTEEDIKRNFPESFKLETLNITVNDRGILKIIMNDKEDVFMEENIGEYSTSLMSYIISENMFFKNMSKMILNLKNNTVTFKYLGKKLKLGGAETQVGVNQIKISF